MHPIRNMMEEARVTVSQCEQPALRDEEGEHRIMDPQTARNAPARVRFVALLVSKTPSLPPVNILLGAL